MTELLHIDWLDGVAYVINPAGRIIAYGRPHWNRFAAENEAADLCEAESIIGLDLLGIVRGKDVCAAYRHLIKELLQGRRDGFAFAFRCDAPHMRREMRMAITPVRRRGEVTSILFQSILLNQEMRPPLDIFRFGDQAAALGCDPGQKVVTLCSWCQKVRADDWGSDPRWISAEEYYRCGGEVDVLINHGICEGCTASLQRG